MNNKKVLLLYPLQPGNNAALVASLQNAGAEVEELVIDGNIERVLDLLEQPLTPVVIPD